MNQNRDVQPPLLETDAPYGLPPDAQRKVTQAKQLPTWKRRQRIRRHINARLFAFTIVSLFVGLIAGYYLGNNRSFDGFLAGTNQAEVKPEPAATRSDADDTSRTGERRFDESVGKSTGDSESLSASANQPETNQSFSDTNLNNNPSANFNSQSGGNPFGEYNRRAGSGNNRESSANVSAANVTLAASGLVIPVAGVKGNQLVDTFTDARSENRSHDAIDIIAARGTPVLAATDGRLARFYKSAKGGLTIYQIAGDGRTVFYYAHLDGFAEGLRAGQELKRGQVIGYVGDTGNAAPGNCHLHFAIWIASDPKRYWEGDNLNPYPLLAK